MTRDGIRVWLYLRTKPRRLSEVLGEFWRNTSEATLGSVGLLILAAANFAGIALFIFAPDHVEWSRIPLSNTVRWIGVAIASAGALGEMWALIHLGRQYSGLLRIRGDHALVAGGPYR